MIPEILQSLEPRSCGYKPCGKTFTPSRTWQFYCCAECRRAHGKDTFVTVKRTALATAEGLAPVGSPSADMTQNHADTLRLNFILAHPNLVEIMGASVGVRTRADIDLVMKTEEKALQPAELVAEAVLDKWTEGLSKATSGEAVRDYIINHPLPDEDVPQRLYGVPT